jgi:hypothetical protein
MLLFASLNLQRDKYVYLINKRKYTLSFIKTQIKIK